MAGVLGCRDVLWRDSRGRWSDGYQDSPKRGEVQETSARQEVKAERPHPACWMVKKVGQLAMNARKSRPHPACLDGESGCPASAGPRRSQATSFTIRASRMGSCRYLVFRFSHSTLFTIRTSRMGSEP